MNVLLAEVKAYLGITTTVDDVRLQAILDGVNEDIITSIGDITLGTKTQRIMNTQPGLYYFRKKYNPHNLIGLDVINPTQILSINGNDFSTKVLGTDYIINDDGIAVIQNLPLVVRNIWGFYDITYTAGYATTPKSLISTVSEYVGYLYSKDLGKDTLQEKMGPRGVVYERQSRKASLKSFNEGLERFIPIYLKIY